MVTSNTLLATKEPTQVLIDTDVPENKQTNLAHTSAIKCENLYTLPISDVRKIGHLSDALIDQVDFALKASLDLK